MSGVSTLDSDARRRLLLPARPIGKRTSWVLGAFTTKRFHAAKAILNRLIIRMLVHGHYLAARLADMLYLQWSGPPYSNSYAQ